MGGCQNYGPFLGTLNIRCHIITGTQKGTIILTTTHINPIRFLQLPRLTMSEVSWQEPSKLNPACVEGSGFKVQGLGFMRFRGCRV